MSDVLISLFLGLGLAIPSAVCQWMSWQGMKKGTILPAGSFTKKYGKVVAVAVVSLGLVPIVEVGVAIRWWVILTLFTMWFLGGWLATLVERALYGKKETIEGIVFFAQHLVKDQGEEASARVTSKVVPKWWVKLMSPSWRRDLASSLSQVKLH